jgi:hypothetical protein
VCTIVAWRHDSRIASRSRSGTLWSATSWKIRSGTGIAGAQAISLMSGQRVE